MILKRYWYNNFTILAPLKCGTRWLSDYTSPLGFSKLDNHTNIMKYYQNNSKTNYFVYREPEKHFITAFHTEVLAYSRTNHMDEINLKPLIDMFKTNEAKHWSINLWETLFNEIVKTKNHFEFINLNKLSNLFDNKFVHNKNEYDFNNDKLHLTKNELLKELKRDYPNEWIFFNSIIKKETDWMNKTIYLSKNINIWDATFTDT